MASWPQFGSKTVLLEALCGALAESGQMGGLEDVFTTGDPIEALHGFVATFARFWDANRVVMRRLRALTHLDGDVGAVITARDARRRQGLGVLAGLLAEQPRVPGVAPGQAALVTVLTTLTAFETFDTLVGADQRSTDVVPVVNALVDAVLADPPAGSPPRSAGHGQRPATTSRPGRRR